jgi:ABC-type transport system involved in cytochrome c biogenesis permease subunit
MNDPNSIADPHANYGEPASLPSSFGPMFRKLLKPLASLQLTVVLFVLGMILVFYGTLAQIDLGIWTVVHQYFRSWIVWIPLQLNAEFWDRFFVNHDAAGVGVDEIAHWPGSFPFPGGWLIGTAMLVNLLAAHTVRFKLAWRRSGILMIHSGLIALMLGELITGLFAVEGNMTIVTGQSANYIEDLRHVELAIIDPSDPNFNQVTLVDDHRLRQEGVIRDDRLPFDVRIDRFMSNSRILNAPADKDNRATKGYGLKAVAEERPEVSGTETKQSIDFPSAYLTFLDKLSGESLGAYLVSLELGMEPDFATQNLTVGEKTYQIAFRLKRTFKPYTIHLQKFEHKVYAGTDKPRDYASTVRLIDPDDGEDREVRIWMNHPLRHRGETLYQQSFIVGDAGTILQVVRNPGWIIPYVSCFMISFGLIIHFVLALVKYMQRQGVRREKPRQQREKVRLSPFATYFPYAVVGLMALYFASKAFPPSSKEGAMDLYSAGQIAVQEGGRVKPLDSVARYRLLVISGKQEFVEGKEGDDDSGPSWVPIPDFGKKREPAIRWLLDTMADGDNPQSSAFKHKVIRIDNDQILNMLNLKARPGFYRYSLEEVVPHFGELTHAKMVAEKREKLKRGITDNKVLELYGHLGEYEMLIRRADPGLIPGANPDDKWDGLAAVDLKTMKAHRDEIEAAESDLHQKALLQLRERLERKGINPEMLQRLPPEQQDKFLEEMTDDIREQLQREFAQELAAKYRSAEQPQAGAFAKILDAYRLGEVAEFNAAVADYHKQFNSTISTRDMRRVRLETLFNHISPFYLCGVFYIMVGVLASLSWLCWTEPLRRSAWGLMVFTFVIHTCGLIIRMYLQGRPPVTNLYSSAVFIGWGGIALCIGLEAYYRNGVANAVGAALGFATMRIAYFLGGSGDSLEMMEAVLDTNLWLATHVTIVTLGYTATFVAGLISVYYVLRGLFTTSLDDASNKRISGNIYGVLCFATFLSFTGTVLGGIWADQSWGRFWGWDAKENGAVLVVIWNTLILHARWCGLVKARGMAVLSMVGIIVTVWSWFGTNQLGAGLHAYGFNNQLALGCRYTWLICLALVGIGLLPLKYWRSFSPEVVQERADRARQDAQARKELEQTEAKRRAKPLSPGR